MAGNELYIFPTIKKRKITYFCHMIKKCIGSFYIAQYPVRWTAQSASHFLPSPTDLFIPTPFSASPGSILARQQLRAKTKSLTFPPLSIARYSFIQLSEQGRLCEVNEKCPISETVAKGDSNPGSLDWGRKQADTINCHSQCDFHLKKWYCM